MTDQMKAPMNIHPAIRETIANTCAHIVREVHAALTKLFNQ